MSITHLAAAEPGPQGLDAPLLLARIRPWRQDPNALFGGPAAGRSTVTLTTWPGAGAPIEADWTQIRNWRAARLGRAFRDTEGDAFWLAFDRPGAATGRTTRAGASTEHVLRATATGPQVARLQCPVNCRHQPTELEALAAELGRDHAPATGNAALPATIPGIPGITFQQRSATTIAVQQHAQTTLITLAHPAGAHDIAALGAHGVRRTAA